MTLGELMTVKTTHKKDEKSDQPIRLFHLSHNDLDGYSCQMITKRFFPKTHFFNSGYGQEVSAKLNAISDQLRWHTNFNAGEQRILLISDINITKDECKLAESIAQESDTTLYLLDHHKSGEAQAREFKWYFLDNERCATKITYDWCKERFPQSAAAKDSIVAEYVECVNVYDLWKSEDKQRFEFGKVLNRLVMEAREIGQFMFGDRDNEYRLSLLEDALKFLDNYRNIELDDHLLSIKKHYLSEGKASDTIDNLTAKYVVTLLIKNRDRFTIHYGEYKGLLTYQIGNSSILGNEFLQGCPDYHFFMDVNKNGNTSLRANNALDVSAMASKLFGGGGHANASGGRIIGFRDVYTYEQLRDRIRPILEAV